MTELISVFLKKRVLGYYTEFLAHIKLKHLMHLISIHILSNIHLKLANRQLNKTDRRTELVRKKGNMLMANVTDYISFIASLDILYICELQSEYVFYIGCI